MSRLLPDATPSLRAIMDGGRGPVEPPIRSEIFGPQRFAQHGRSLGATHRATLARGWGRSFFPRLRDNIQVLREAHAYIAQQATTGYDISPAAEWLLDNFHLIDAQLREIREGLQRSYFRLLPFIDGAPIADRRGRRRRVLRDRGRDADGLGLRAPRRARLTAACAWARTDCL